MKKELFEKVNGKDVFLFTMENKNGMQLSVCNFGALIINLCVPDKNGKVDDVALGYDTLEKYLDNNSFFGAIIGPNANRIDNAKYILDGTTYTLDANDGTNNLHSHRELGVHKRIWEYTEFENSVEFTLNLKDGEMGFGGNKTFMVKYSLTDENELVIEYNGTSDKETVINLTNHCYFNLDGHSGKTIRNHKLTLFASAYTPVDKKLIPTGDILRVIGTPFDFLTEHKIGERIDDDFDQLILGGGYDHNWVLDNYTGLIRKIAVIKNTDETRTMEVYTDLPGVQFYSGNMLQEKGGKGGVDYNKNGAFAFETQFYPDSVNKPHFPSAIFGPERPYKSTTIYKFI